MTADFALQFLRDHQPMPSDVEITNDQAKSFCAVLDFFEHHPDSRCVPLLINAINESTGLGMYEKIGTVLLTQNRDDVIKHLHDGLTKGNNGVKYRSCWWAADVRAWELEDQISHLLHHTDEDIRDAAASFVSLRQSQV